MAVARIAGARAWLRADIEAYLAGEPVPARREAEAQAELTDSKGMSALVALSQDALLARIHEQRWDRVPKPSGQVGNAHFWERSEYKEWKRERRHGD